MVDAARCVACSTAVRKRRSSRALQAVAVGDVDQLVIGRHALLLGKEGAARAADEIHLVELEIAEGADHRVDLARDQRRRQREVDVDQLDVGELQAVLRQHGAQQRVLEAADREADLAALQVGDRS